MTTQNRKFSTSNQVDCIPIRSRERITLMALAICSHTYSLSTWRFAWSGLNSILSPVVCIDIRWTGWQFPLHDGCSNMNWFQLNENPITPLNGCLQETHTNKKFNTFSVSWKWIFHFSVSVHRDVNVNCNSPFHTIPTTCCAMSKQFDAKTIFLLR